MSEENMTEEQKPDETKSTPRKNSLPLDEVKAMCADVPSYMKSAFHMIGHKGGIRLAVPSSSGVSRAFFYGKDDYTLIPDDPAITIFSPEERKERKLGGIMARVDFDLGLDAARRALGKLIDVVRTAPVAEPAAAEEPSASED